MTEKKTKNGIIELLRFIGIAFIMCDHMGQIGLKDLKRPFTGTWVYVELFLMLTGFFTAKHFQSLKTNNTISEYVTNSVKYTIKKFSRFIPFVVCVVLVEYLLKYRMYIAKGDFYNFFANIQEMPFSMFLLSAAGTKGTMPFPLWYLSATFLVCPIVCIVVQFKNKHITGLISFYPAVFYYLYRERSIGDHTFPNQIIRALCGMLLGVLVFLATEHIKKRTIGRIGKSILSGCLLASIVVLMYINYKGYSFISTYLICFIVIIVLSFSEKTYIPSCSNPFFLYLGKLSLFMFIWHYTIAHLLILFIPETQVALRILVYYLGTILISIISLIISKAFHRAPNIKH